MVIAIIPMHALRLLDVQQHGRYLLETIESQPREAERILGDDSAARAADRLAGAERIFVVGTGTSFHGAMFGEHVLRSAGRDAWAVPAFEFARYPRPLGPTDGLVLVSHRGSKRYSREALERFSAGCDRWVVVTGNDSELGGEGAVLTCPQERSICHTASHTLAMLRLAQLAVALAPSPPGWQDALAEVPDAIDEALHSRTTMAEIAAELDVLVATVFLGGGPSHAPALEGALKLREAAHVPVEGQHLEGILHGPLLNLAPGQAALVVTEPGASLERAREVIAALGALGMAVAAVGSSARDLVIARWQVLTRRLPEVLSPLVNVVPFQWLAYEVARRQGADPDIPRSDEAAFVSALQLARL
jgi:glutamine---fructose-6-phosphate transaminase (isomerizing)